MAAVSDISVCHLCWLTLCIIYVCHAYPSVICADCYLLWLSVPADQAALNTHMPVDHMMGATVEGKESATASAADKV